MRSQRGMTIITLVLVVIILLLLAGVCAYVVLGPNGPLNPEEVEPLPASETYQNKVA